MRARPPRQSLIPNANNVRLLARLVELVARGVRDNRTLAMLLDCEVRTVNYYTQAGDWLNLLSTDEKTLSPTLTRLGTEYAFSGKERGRVYARAVWQNPFVVQLMDGRTKLPESAVIAQFIQASVPDMAPSTARRRATSVRALLEPAMRYPAPKTQSPGHQLSFDLGLGRPRKRPPRMQLSGGSDHSPEAYRVVLRALLDHGELSLWHIRAILDWHGGEDCPVGSYVEMAVRRGDGWRVGDRLVVSWGAVWRRDLSDTVAGVALSDPGYRHYLSVLREASEGHPGAAMEYAKLQKRYGSWDKRVFGSEITPARLAEDLDRVLLGRPIDAFPLADDPGPEPGEQTGPFLELVETTDLFIALPPTLMDLVGGVSGVNRILEKRRAQEGGQPAVVDRRELVHGGLFAPGEPRSRAIPDRVSLRQRALAHIPHLAMLVALLQLHRRSGGELAVSVQGTRLDLRIKRRRYKDLLFHLDEFCSMQGWLVSRRLRGGLSGEQLAEVLEALGIALRVGNGLVLEEAFFLRLQSDVEDHELFERLGPLGDRVVRFLEQWPR